jgi:predicted Rossmann-fold nucleotide-binding protein
LLERLDYLVHVASGFIVLEGSIGTMAELFLTWNLLAVDGRPQAPLICRGRPYAEFLRAMSVPGLVVPDMLRFVQVAETPAAAVALLRVPAAAISSPEAPAR